MTDRSMLDQLRGLEIFHDISDRHLERLVGIARMVDFQAHETIFQEHEPAEDVFLIVDGKVSLVICAPKVGCRQLTVASSGELIGWSPLVGRGRLSDTARALEHTRAIAINGEKLLQSCRDDAEFGFEFMHRVAMVLAQRLGATRLQLLEMSGVRLPEVGLESD